MADEDKYKRDPEATAKFKGQEGEYHRGVPARDLDAEDIAQLDEEGWRTVVDSPLYEVATSKAQANTETRAARPPSGKATTPAEETR